MMYPIRQCLTFPRASFSEYLEVHLVQLPRQCLRNLTIDVMSMNETHTTVSTSDKKQKGNYLRIF